VRPGGLRVALCLLAVPFTGACSDVEHRQDDASVASGTGGGSPGTTSAGSGAACTPGETRACYTGPATTEGVGPCAAGTWTCNADGTTFGPCEGEVTPKQEDCATEADDDCNGVPPIVCPGPLECGNAFGGPGYDEAFGLSIGRDGRIAISGRYQPPVDFGGGALDPNDPESGAAYVAVYSGDGSHVFSHGFAAGPHYPPRVGYDDAARLFMTATYKTTLEIGDVALTSADGAVEMNVASIAMDTSGGVLWTRTFQSGQPYYGGPGAIGLAPDGTGGVVTIGAVSIGADLGNGLWEPVDGSGSYVARVIDAEVDWVVTSENAVPLDAASAPGADTVVVGVFEDALGFAEVASAGGGDGFVLDLDPAGAPSWALALGGTDNDLATAVAVDGLGRISVAVHSAAGFAIGGQTVAPGVSLVRLAPGGSVSWAKHLGDGEVFAVDMADNGRVVVAGRLKGVANWGAGPVGELDSVIDYVLVLDEDAGYAWSTTWPKLSQYGHRARFDTAGDVVVVGSFEAPLDFGCGPLVSAGSEDIFLVKLDVP